MKVLHVIPSVARRYGGPSAAVFQMCRALMARGVECAIATTDADGRGRLRVPIGVVEDYERVPTIFFRRDWSEGLKYSQGLSRWLSNEVHGFDLVHIHAVFSHSSLSAARASRRRGVPYLVRPLGSLHPWSLARKRLRKMLLSWLFVNQMMTGAVRVHYTSRQEQRLAECRLGLPQGIVVPLGIDERLFETKDGSAFGQRLSQLGDDPYVLTLCRLHPKKGLELLIDAFSDLARKDFFRDWRLVIAGDGDARYVQTLRRRAAGNLRGDRILFPGWLDGAEKAGALRGAGLFVLASAQENFALSVVEAMACGVPVIVGERMDLAEEIREEKAGWVAPMSRPGLLHSISEALGSEPERKRYGEAGRGWAIRRFRWPQIAAQLESSYQAVLSELGSSRPAKTEQALVPDGQAVGTD